MTVFPLGSLCAPQGSANGFPGKSSADWGWVQHMHASLNATGRAAVVLDTGAASRGSGNVGTSKERTVRQWFVDHDLIESVLYLPENLFYNTSAPGIVIFLSKAKPKERQGKVFLVNAGRIFETITLPEGSSPPVAIAVTPELRGGAESPTGDALLLGRTDR